MFVNSSRRTPGDSVPRKKKQTTDEMITELLSNVHTQAAQMMEQLVQDCDELDNAMALAQEKGDDQLTRVQRTHQDRLRAISNDEEKRKLLADLRARTQQTRQETARVQAETEQMQKQIEFLDKCADEGPILQLQEDLIEHRAAFAERLKKFIGQQPVIDNGGKGKTAGEEEAEPVTAVENGQMETE